MAERDALEEQAREQAEQLLDFLVQRSESIDSRQGTYLLAALAAELGLHVQRRCWELAKSNDPSWEIGGSEAETLINGAWRVMATIAALSDQEDRRVLERQERRDRADKRSHDRGEPGS